MNKFILNLPKPILKNYVLKNFEELTIEDFFIVIDKEIDIPSSYYEKNKTLNTSSRVLFYALDKDASAFNFFDVDAFNTSCIEKIAKVNKDLSPEELKRFPILLTNSDICEVALRNYPFLIKQVDREMINDKIVKILENTYYSPDKDDLDRNPIFLESEKLLIKAVSNDPSLILYIPLNEKIIHEAIKKEYVPHKEAFYSNPKLKEYYNLLELAFKKDPSMIVFFEDKYLTYQLAEDAVKRGYVATEEDLLYNPTLGSINHIMDVAIKNNPKLIKYVKKHCYLKFEVIEEALKKYKITKEDLEENPEICGFVGIMQYLPDFYLYSAFLTEEEKIKEIEKNLRDGIPISASTLPFFDYRFGGKADASKLNELSQILNIEIDENSTSMQKKYYEILNNLIDGLTNSIYESNKSNFKYSNFVSLNEEVLNCFNTAKEKHDYQILIIMAKNIYEFCGGLISLEEISNTINKLYEMFLKNENLDINKTTTFYNQILNEHRNSYMSIYKQKIIESLAANLELTEKKKNTILNSIKLKRISEFIQNMEYDKLQISLLQFRKHMDKIKSDILKNKDIRKSGITIDEILLEKLISIFSIKGALNKEQIFDTLKINDEEIAKFIINKFEKFKLNFVDKIELTEQELYMLEFEKMKIGGINYKNFIIVNKDNIYNNISKILLKLDDETLNKILNNRYFLSEVLYLIPFVDLIPEFNIDNFINILSNYERVRNKIGTANKFNLEKDLSSKILKNISDLITLSNAYSSVDDVVQFALGTNVVKQVGEHYSNEYLNFYIKMIDRQTSMIPSVSFENQDYKLQSGVYSDSERLLIGKKPSVASCIDLMNLAGKNTYQEVLINDFGDVILIKDSMNNLKSRIFLIRRGNVIQLFTMSGENFDINILKQIADKIIQKSVENEDNIDFVFLNSSSNFNANNYPQISDVRFKSLFPHADLSPSAILLSSKLETFDSSKLDFNAIPKAKYLKTRKKINYNPSELEITRLRALSIVMENDTEKKENLSRNFEPFYMGEYNKVVCGEDWYIAEKKDGTIEEIILPTIDIKKLEEISQIKNEMFYFEDLKEIKK